MFENSAVWSRVDNKLFPLTVAEVCAASGRKEEETMSKAYNLSLIHIFAGGELFNRPAAAVEHDAGQIQRRAQQPQPDD